MTAPVYEDVWLSMLRFRMERPGWHGPRTAEQEAEREAQSRKWRTERLAREARRSANPMWAKVSGALGGQTECYDCGGTRPEDVDAVMDAVYGEGRW